MRYGPTERNVNGGRKLSCHFSCVYLPHSPIIYQLLVLVSPQKTFREMFFMTKLTWRSPKLTTKTITLAAMLIALHTVLGKISFGSDNTVKFSIGFIGTILIGYYLGPWLGGVSLVLADLIKSTIFSSGSTFFIGFTFSAGIAGIIAGAFLYQQKITWQRLFAYELVQILVSNIFFNTLWIHLMYKAPVIALLTVRVPKNVIMWPIEALIGLLVLQAVSRVDKRIRV